MLSSRLVLLQLGICDVVEPDVAGMQYRDVLPLVAGGQAVVGGARDQVGVQGA